MCGCGKCTIVGWRTGDTCQLVRYSEYPKLLIVNREHHSASLFQQSYDKHSTLCKETSIIIEQFQKVVRNIWNQLHEFDSESQKKIIPKIIRLLQNELNIKLPMFLTLDDLQDHFHSLNVSWYNFHAIHLLLKQDVVKQSSNLLADWKGYLTSFKDYCSARNLKDLSNVFFITREQNIFILEVDELYDNFKLSDIDGLRKSLSIALCCSFVCLHLVTVRATSLFIYFHYCYTDYLTVFKSLTAYQLKMISEIGGSAYNLLSMTDAYNQFQYTNIQSFAEVR